MKRLYIITGANGHLASTIIRYLRNTDCHIRGLILPSEHGMDDRQVTYYHGDVSKPESLQEIFSYAECNEVVVIHAAGIISISDQENPLMNKVNVEGTRNIVAQCIRHHVKRLVYVSSVHAIPQSKAATVTETDSFSKDAVVGAYARSKAEATQAVIEAARQGLDAVIVHPSGIIGPYDPGKNHIVQMIQMYISGRLPAGISGGYDFVDVRDVAKGCIAAVDKGQSGECYILSNRYFTVHELLSYARDAIGGRKKLCIPISFARLFAPFLQWIARMTHTRPLYTRYALYTLSEQTHFSHDKATATLGYRPRDMRETIEDTISSLLGQKVELEKVYNAPTERKNEYES